MQNKIKLPCIGIALLTAISLTGCSENAKRPVPASPVVTADSQLKSETPISDEESPSEKEPTLSIPSSQDNSVESPVNADSVSINGDVIWGLGKTFDELTERYGDITMGNFDTYYFKKGYGIYAWAGGADPTQTDRDKNIEMIRGRGGCVKIGDISAKDFLIGDLSTVTLDNIAEKCGFEVVPLNPTPDGETMYDGYRMAYYTHPSYENVMFGMVYKESGFDDTAIFLVSYDG